MRYGMLRLRMASSKTRLYALVAIEYGKIGIGVILLPAQFGYLVDYNIALLHIAVCLIHSDGLSLSFSERPPCEFAAGSSLSGCWRQKRWFG